jgi:cold shock CspA family protein
MQDLLIFCVELFCYKFLLSACFINWEFQRVMKGQVKFFHQEKGYGFVYGEDGRDYYFNVRDIQGVDLPNNKDEVVFEPKETAKSPRATKLKIVATSTNTTTDLHSGDQRERCHSCGKKMVPRIGFYRGTPDKSYCPFCGGVHKDFSAIVLDPEDIIAIKKAIKNFFHIAVRIAAIIIFLGVISLLLISVD